MADPAELRVDVIAKVLMWNMTLTDDDQWLMDDDSPRSMAEKIVRTLDGEAPDGD
jgi:hypothetical protein